MPLTLHFFIWVLARLLNFSKSDTHDPYFFPLFEYWPLFFIPLFFIMRVFLPGRNDMTFKFFCAALRVLPHPPLRLPQLLVLLHAVVLILPLLLPGFPQLQGLTGRHLHFQQPHPLLPKSQNRTLLIPTYRHARPPPPQSRLADPHMQARRPHGERREW